MTKAKQLLGLLSESVDNDLIEYMAFVLLVESFTSEIEYAMEGESSDYDEDIARDIHSEATAPRQDILKTVPAYWRELGINYKDSLPLKFVKEFVTSWEKEWGAENVKAYLDEFGEDGAFKAIMNGVGHGVTPFDDKDSEDFLKKRGITKLKTYVGDDYHTSGSDIFDKVYNKVKDGYED